MTGLLSRLMGHVQPTRSTEEQRLRHANLFAQESPPVSAPVTPSGEPAEHLTGMLIASDRTTEDNRMQEQALTGYVNVTSLPAMCPRAMCIAQTSGNAHTCHKTVNSNDRIIWEMGRATERAVRDRLIPNLGLENVVGRWLCPCEASEATYTDMEGLEGEYLPCECGRKKIDQYREVTIYDHDVGIRGNCDLPYFNAAGEIVPTEVKSIKGEAFTALTNPQPDHVYQASAYHRLYERAGYVVAPYVRVLYISKNTVRGSPYKERLVLLQDHHHRRLDIEWDKARLYKQYREMNQLPPRLPVCSAPNTPRAKECEVVTSCFSRRQ